MLKRIKPVIFILMVLVVIFAVALSSCGSSRNVENMLDKVSECKTIADVEEVLGKADFRSNGDRYKVAEYYDVSFRGNEGSLEVFYHTYVGGGSSISYTFEIPFETDSPTSEEEETGKRLYTETFDYFTELYGESKYEDYHDTWETEDGWKIELYPGVKYHILKFEFSHIK